MITHLYRFVFENAVLEYLISVDVFRRSHCSCLTGDRKRIEAIKMTGIDANTRHLAYITIYKLTVITEISQKT